MKALYNSGTRPFCKSKSLPAFVLLAAVSFGFYFGLSHDYSSSYTGFNPDLGTVTLTEFGGAMVGSWSYGASVLPPSRFAGAGISYMRNDTGWLYVMGGDQNGLGSITKRNERYNLRTNSWSVMDSMLSVLQYFGAARLRDSLYTVGGLTTAFLTSAVNNLRRYSINQNAWVERTPLPVVLGWCEAAGYQDSLIYVLGGMISGGGNGGPQVYLYNALSNTWRSATSLPASRVGGACTIKGDTIIYVGGNTSYFGAPVAAVYKGLISQSNRSVITWSTGADKPGTTRWRFDAHDWGCKGIIVDMGGISGFGISNEVYTYSPGLNTWTQQPNSLNPTSTSQSGSFQFSGSVYKLVCASGLTLTPPFSIPQTQIFTDTLCPVINYPQTIVCRTSINKPILDHVLTFDTINVGLGSMCLIKDLNVRIDNVTHTFDSDLRFYLRKGSMGQRIVDRAGGSGDNFIGTVLNDSAAITINSGFAPFTGQYRPSVPAVLSSFNDQPTDGGWILTITDTAGNNTGQLSAWCLVISYLCPVGGIQTVEIPNYFALKQNYPNPFNPATTIEYALPGAGNVRLVVYDILGREAATLVNEFKQAGIYKVEFDASNLSSGVYFYRLLSSTFTETKRMALIK